MCACLCSAPWPLPSHATLGLMYVCDCIRLCLPHRHVGIRDNICSVYVTHVSGLVASSFSCHVPCLGPLAISKGTCILFSFKHLRVCWPDSALQHAVLPSMQCSLSGSALLSSRQFSSVLALSIFIFYICRNQSTRTTLSGLLWLMMLFIPLWKFIRLSSCILTLLLTCFLLHLHRYIYSQLGNKYFPHS